MTPLEGPSPPWKVRHGSQNEKKRMSRSRGCLMCLLTLDMCLIAAVGERSPRFSAKKAHSTHSSFHGFRALELFEA